MERPAFPSHTMLRALVELLRLNGHATTEAAIARGMEAHRLFLHSGGRYLTGASFYRPEWLNLYLHPQGFHLAEHALPKAETGVFFRSHAPCMLRLMVAPNVQRVIVYTGHAAGKYQFAVCPRPDEAAPPTMALSTDGLLRRLPDTATIYTLEQCTPAPVDFLPLMAESLRTLRAYKRELLRTCERVVTREDMAELHPRLFRALLVDGLPMAALAGDEQLLAELEALHHDYRHLFIAGEQANRISDRVPVSRLRAVLGWLQENLVDRMYELGASDDEVDAALED